MYLLLGILLNVHITIRRRYSPSIKFQRIGSHGPQFEETPLKFIGHEQHYEPGGIKGEPYVDEYSHRLL